MKKISNVIQIKKREEDHVVGKTIYFIGLEREREREKR